MFKPGRFNGTLIILSLAVCFFLGAFSELEAVAQPCPDDGRTFTVPGEVNRPAGENPDIVSPEQPVNRPGCFTFGGVGGCPPYRWTTEPKPGVSVDPETGTYCITEEACGSIPVSVKDSCNRTITYYYRILNAPGKWVISFEGCCDPEVYPCYDWGGPLCVLGTGRAASAKSTLVTSCEGCGDLGCRCPYCKPSKDKKNYCWKITKWVCPDE